MPNVSSKTVQWIVGIVLVIIMSLLGTIWSMVDQRLDKQDKDIDTIMEFMLNNF